MSVVVNQLLVQIVKFMCKSIILMAYPILRTGVKGNHWAFGKENLSFTQVKFLMNKRGAAMVEMGDHIACNTVIQCLGGQQLFGSQIDFRLVLFWPVHC